MNIQSDYVNKRVDRCKADHLPLCRFGFETCLKIFEKRCLHRSNQELFEGSSSSMVNDDRRRFGRSIGRFSSPGYDDVRPRTSVEVLPMTDIG